MTLKREPGNLGHSVQSGPPKVWGGEFGRTPFWDGRTAKSEILGCDRYSDCFRMWMTGGGMKVDSEYGLTGKHGFGVAEKWSPRPRPASEPAAHL